MLQLKWLKNWFVAGFQICYQFPGFINNYVREHLGMLYHMNNTFWNTIFEIFVNVSLTCSFVWFWELFLLQWSNIFLFYCSWNAWTEVFSRSSINVFKLIIFALFFLKFTFGRLPSSRTDEFDIFVVWFSFTNWFLPVSKFYYVCWQNFHKLRFNSYQDKTGKTKSPLYQFFPWNFCKRSIQHPKYSDF